MELSYKHKLSHISSCLNAVNLLDWIYDNRGEDDPVILDNSHASLGLFVVLEKYEYCDAEEMVTKYGTHASRDMKHGVWVSGGSLGQAATTAVGFALSNKNRKVWLVTSDGAAMEGCVYEALRFANTHCPNLQVWIVYNGYSAYGEVAKIDLPIFGSEGLFEVDENRYPEFLRGLKGHYHVLNETEYLELTNDT